MTTATRISIAVGLAQTLAVATAAVALVNLRYMEWIAIGYAVGSPVAVAFVLPPRWRWRNRALMAILLCLLTGLATVGGAIAVWGSAFEPSGD